MKESVATEQMENHEQTKLLPMTESQNEIWLALQLDDSANCAYNESVSLSMRGILDVEALRQSLQQIGRQHDALKSTFTSAGVQVHYDMYDRFELADVDLSKLDPANRQFCLRKRLDEDALTPFDIELGPLFRAELVKLESDHHWLILTAHHLVCDGWSMSVLLADVAEIYSANARGETPQSIDAASYADYAELLEAQVNSIDEAYWIGQFEDPPIPLDLPTDRSRPHARSFASQRYDHTLSPELLNAVRQAGIGNGCSLFVTLLAGFQMLLWRLSGQSDLAVGVPAAGQSALDFPRLVGHCVNLLPLRQKIDSEVDVRNYLRQVRESVLDAYDHQLYTFGTLLRHLNIARDPSRIPLVPVMFNVDEPIDGDGLNFIGLSVELHSNPRAFDNFEMFVNISLQADGAVLECQYNVDLFDKATIVQWMESYEAILQSISVDATQKLARVKALTISQQQQMLVDWNATDRPIDLNRATHQRIAECAVNRPEATAATFDGVDLSYEQLEYSSNRLARHLLNNGVEPGCLAAVYLDRSLDMLIATLAIWKAGAAYLPLDPEFPQQRIEHMLRDSNAIALITKNSLLDELPSTEANIVCVDDEIAANQTDSAFTPADVAPHDLAYVIYTSGSTGNPKGIRVPHGAVVNFLSSMGENFAVAPGDVIPAITTLSFDISVLELFSPLICGATTYIVDADTAADCHDLCDLVERIQPTLMQSTPATWRLLLEAGWAGDKTMTALCGGEAMPSDIVQPLLDRTAQLWNMYGPTETTVWSTCHRVERPAANISIGRPIANTRVYVLDSKMEAVPIGVSGDLYIGGTGVTLGYHNRPDLTADKFVGNPFHDPFQDYVNPLLYATGDKARFRADGQLEFLGRTDLQVKLRGFRVELGDIESTLAQHPLIRQAAAAVHEFQPGDSRLVVYTITETDRTLTATDVRRHLRNTLPEYMIPQHVVELAALPMTVNNKVDRLALPLPRQFQTPAESRIVAPRTESEIFLARLWGELLNVSQVSVNDNFFELGGHSLLTVRMLYCVEQELGLRLKPRLVMLSDLEQLASLIDQARAEALA